MSDGSEVDLARIGSHAVAGGGGAGLVGLVMRFFQSREAQAMRDEFIAMRGDVKHLIEAVAEHKKIFEDVVEIKLAARALHKRVDEYEKRLDRMEARRRR